MQLRKRDIFSLLLLMLVLFNIGSSTLFIHEHNIEGHIVAHSHPFANSPESHSHSLAQLELISRTSRAEMVFAESLVFEPCDIVLEVMLATCELNHYQLRSLSVASLRAPPVA
ncbi:MAG: hypothetical protein J6Q36_05045 [Alistipes sp.]|nr:hypothetical protein [Alistipes sp.]